jgi:acetyl-CoA carboxylase biotin carboxyl carrier protein
MNLEEIKELVQVVVESGVAELEVTRGDNKVLIKKNSQTVTQEIVVPAQAGVQAAAPVGVAPVAAMSPVPAVAAAETGPVEEEGLEYVKSPIVGTFYESAAPDAPPFVRAGDRVSPGQVLCIIESMKLMNEIEAEISGTITAKLVDNAKPVEYGEALFSVKPD